MRPLSPMAFVLAVLLHAGVAFIVVLWTWFQPKQKPPPAVFEMVAAPADYQDSAETGQTSPQADPKVAFSGRYRPVKIPTPPPPEPEQQQAAPTKQPTPRDNPNPKQPTVTRKDSPKDPAKKQTTLADFQKQNPSKRQTSTQRDAPRNQVRAPNIDAREVTQGLRQAMGNAASRSRAASLSASQQSELNEYYDLLHALLQNAWMAPPGIRGPVEVTVVFTVTPGGSITSVRISNSSGYAVFDESALQVFREVRSFRPTPNGESWTFEVPFSLRD